jgi:hypothetical protein
MNPRSNRGQAVPDPLLPGIIVTFPPPYPGYGKSELFYPAMVWQTSKSQMTYPGDRPGFLQTTGFIYADYSSAAPEALAAAIQAEGTPKIEIVTLAGKRVEKGLNWLDEKVAIGLRSERHHKDVPEHIRNSAK